jgi:hypothetical protein
MNKKSADCKILFAFSIKQDFLKICGDIYFRCNELNGLLFQLDFAVILVHCVPILKQVLYC